MIFRSGFVSNSSSSSFVLKKDEYSKLQLEIILNPEKYIEKAKKVYNTHFNLIQDEDETNYDIFDYVEDSKLWTIKENKKSIKFSTFMDNFYWEDFAEFIGKLSEKEVKEIIYDI